MLINKFAKSAFAVFLIHGDSNIEEYLFKNICKVDRIYVAYMRVYNDLYVLIFISVINLISSLVDLIKIHSLDIVINYIFSIK